VTINNGENVLRRIARQLVIPGLAIATALIVSVPVIGFATDWDWAKIGTTYGGLLDGAFFKGYAFANTLVAATPLIFTGLALALGFRGGVFNIGAAGAIFNRCYLWGIRRVRHLSTPCNSSLCGIISRSNWRGFVGCDSWLSQSPFRLS
jgi:hypothetical protein